MSRYLLLALLNIPFITAAIFNTFVGYKLKRVSNRKFIFGMLFWLTILVGLFFAEPLYAFLFSNKLTDTEPLSLFDVIQITAIVVLLYLVARLRSRVDAIERRLIDFHQELSINLSTRK